MRIANPCRRRRLVVMFAFAIEIIVWVCSSFSRRQERSSERENATRSEIDVPDKLVWYIAHFVTPSPPQSFSGKGRSPTLKALIILPYTLRMYINSKISNHYIVWWTLCRTTTLHMCRSLGGNTDMFVEEVYDCDCLRLGVGSSVPIASGVSNRRLGDMGAPRRYYDKLAERRAKCVLCIKPNTEYLHMWLRRVAARRWWLRISRIFFARCVRVCMLMGLVDLETGLMGHDICALH